MPTIVRVPINGEKFFEYNLKFDLYLDIFFKKHLKERIRTLMDLHLFYVQYLKSFRYIWGTYRVWTARGVSMLLVCPWAYKTINVH